MGRRRMMSSLLSPRTTIGTLSLQSVLSSLRDVEGVHGGCLVSSNGDLVASDMPLAVDEAALRALAAQLPGLNAELGLALDASNDSCVLRYSDRTLYVRRVAHGFLCVLTDVGTSTPMLKMMLSVAARRVQAELARHAEVSGIMSTRDG
jgi:predicted regulator of Ras-like GTPase activity (Roadblock/LC7/MglB family)